MNIVQIKIIDFEKIVKLLKSKKGICDTKLFVLKKYISRLNIANKTMPFNSSPISQYDFQSFTFPLKNSFTRLYLDIIN